MYNSYTNRAAPVAYRSGYTGSASTDNTRDDHERWYTDPSANNRMRLSLLSGIDSEIEWALNRLLRLCKNENFYLKDIPGLVDALFEWPEWFSTIGYQEYTEFQLLFAPSPTPSVRRQHAIMSAFILSTAALLNDQNAHDIASSRRTLPLILYTLHNLDSSLDANSEFVYYMVDIFLLVGPTLVLPPRSSPSTSSPLQPLLRIASESSDRSMIIAAFRALTFLFSNLPNTSQLSADSPALSACIKYLPLIDDKALLEASLSYLYAHISHPAMSKAFLLHPDMPSVLRLLVILLLQEQIQETVWRDITAPIHTVSSAILTSKDHELTKAELESLIATPEPKRSFDWINIMFAPNRESEVTQLELWNLYRDTFQPYHESHPLLVAPEVIKNVSHVFEQSAQVVVQPDDPPKFIIKGVGRRKDVMTADKLKCQWYRSQCQTPSCSNSTELYEHVLQHVGSSDEAECQWSSCPRRNIPKEQFRAHVLTHFWSAHLPEKDPSQSESITLSYDDALHPHPNPTRRPPPPSPSSKIHFQRTINDAPSSSLLALLCLRILFQTSFVSVEAAPKVDEDHFGFPGITEADDDDGTQPLEGSALEDEKEGRRRGRKAFRAVRKLFDGVEMKDNVLMGWITEMIDAATDTEGIISVSA